MKMIGNMWVQLLLLVALSSLCAVSSGGSGRPFYIRGRVYCDTCRCGFETNKTTYIPRAKVRIECEDRKTSQLKYSVAGKTDKTGTFIIKVEEDHKDEICYASLVGSPLSNCRTADPGRSRSQVILTRDNGAISDLHFANSLGFLRDQPLAGCAELVHELLYSDL
ncbi:protein DOWNSTREAM OF FLC [Euphorbia lathyris]|uniref:protein DOWNSTREAM OF FLC n=1 Tax=Euphorbia lathyris TaxID=212925 RepID=UPI003313F896